MSVNEENNIDKLLEELEKFQESLDNNDIKITLEDLRAWAGHINFCMYVIVEESQKIKEAIYKIIKKDSADSKKKDNSKEKDRDIYI